MKNSLGVCGLFMSILMSGLMVSQAAEASNA
jgi:hypothetical protein